MREFVQILYISISLVLLGACSGDVATPEADAVVSIAHLCSMARGSSQPIKDDIVVRGRVVANDCLGELPGAVIIDDGSAGIKVMVEAERVTDYLPLYSSVTLYCSGLYIGRQGRGVVVGARPTADFVVDRVAEKHIFDYMVVGDADDGCVPLRRTLAEIELGDAYRYVVVEGISVVEEEQGLAWCDRDPLTGFYQNSVRHITDGTDTLPVVVSKECVYAQEVLPPLTFRCEAVVDIYEGEIALRITNHRVEQL